MSKVACCNQYRNSLVFRYTVKDQINASDPRVPDQNTMMLSFQLRPCIPRLNNGENKKITVPRKTSRNNHKIHAYPKSAASMLPSFSFLISVNSDAITRPTMKNIKLLAVHLTKPHNLSKLSRLAFDIQYLPKHEKKMLHDNTDSAPDSSTTLFERYHSENTAVKVAAGAATVS